MIGAALAVLAWIATGPELLVTRRARAGAVAWPLLAVLLAVGVLVTTPERSSGAVARTS